HNLLLYFVKIKITQLRQHPQLTHTLVLLTLRSRIHNDPLQDLMGYRFDGPPSQITQQSQYMGLWIIGIQKRPIRNLRKRNQCITEAKTRHGSLVLSISICRIYVFPFLSFTFRNVSVSSCRVTCNLSFNSSNSTISNFSTRSTNSERKNGEVSRKILS